MEKIFCHGKKFYTESGKEVIFNGANIVCKKAETGYIYPEEKELMDGLQKMGFNLIRYGIFWDGVEPEPGIYNDAYLSRVKEGIRYAEKLGMYVMMDMHQDLFARKFIDGAPDWATLDEGLPHPKNCTMWYEAYLSSEAIIRAADNFWADKEAPDGVGVLTHYEKMWEHIAEVLSDCDNVIGFEAMNEPFMGSLARNAFGYATMKIREKDPEFDIAHPERVSVEEQMEYLQIVSSELQKFDRTTLMDFYRRMLQAIRKTSDKPLITGGNIYCSSNMHSGIQRLEDEDGFQIYSPHGYDAVVDSDRYEFYNLDNVRYLFMDKRATQEELQLPVIVGEWGAFPSKSFTNDLIEFMNGILEENLWGSTYYDMSPGKEKDPNFAVLSRAYPRETSGVLLNYHYDRKQNTFTETIENANGGHCISVPFVPLTVTLQTEKGTKDLLFEFVKISETSGRVFFEFAENGNSTVIIKGE